jgi:hypothetical protein
VPPLSASRIRCRAAVCGHVVPRDFGHVALRDFGHVALRDFGHVALRDFGHVALCDFGHIAARIGRSDLQVAIFARLDIA